jgi:hypothetical protein
MTPRTSSFIGDEFLVGVALGKYSNRSLAFAIGNNPDVDNGTLPEDCWNYGDLYNFTANEGADYYISSSDANDTQSIGLNILTVDENGDWNREIYAETLEGQTKKLIEPPSGNPVVRVNFMRNLTLPDNAGNIYLYENSGVINGVPTDPSKVRGFIAIGDNATASSIFSVPSGEKALGLQQFASYSGANKGDVLFSVRIRDFGGPFFKAAPISLSDDATSFAGISFKIAFTVEPKGDFRMQIDGLAVGVNNVGITLGNYFLQAKI